MPRVPYEYYARYLLVAQGISLVREKITQLGYPEPTEDYLQGLRRLLQDSRPSPCLPGSRAREDWLRKHKLIQISTFRPAALKARELLSDLKFRPVLEMLLIGGLAPEYIADQLTFMSGVRVEEEAVRLFGHYFWNRDIMGQEDWRVFLTEIGPNGYPVDRYLNGRDLLQAYLGDPSVALWKVGITQEVDGKTAVESILQDAIMRFKELKLEPNTVNLSLKMERIGMLALRAVEQQQGMGGAARAVIDKMHRMGIRVLSMPIKDARALLESSSPSEELLDEPEAKVLRLTAPREEEFE